MKKKEIIIGFVVLVLGVVGYFGYHAYQFGQFLGDLGECGMSAGPIYGDSINVNLDRTGFEQQLDIPNGKFGLLNLSDSLPPKLIKLDKENNLIWAVEFREDSLVGLPHQRLSEMQLIKDEHGIRLSFFNNSYGEPGRIYLTEDYELEYMCLSPM
jgi:hypothetical protein